jgi:hypothetical protein
MVIVSVELARTSLAVRSGVVEDVAERLPDAKRLYRAVAVVETVAVAAVGVQAQRSEAAGGPLPFDRPGRAQPLTAT